MHHYIGSEPIDRFQFMTCFCRININTVLPKINAANPTERPVLDGTDYGVVIGLA